MALSIGRSPRSQLPGRGCATLPGMRYWPRLIDVLLAAPHRVAGDGTIHLTAAEAHVMRACGFSDAGVGRWHLPPIPTTHVWIPEYLLRLVPYLVRETPTVTACPAPVAAPTPPRTWRYAQRLHGDLRDDNRPSLTWRLGEALRHPVQARVLRSLAGRDEAGCKKRTLQQHLRRLPASALNPALDQLVRVGLVLREKTWLALSVEVCEALHAVEIDVRRAKKARAMRTAKTRTSAGTRQETRTRAAAGTRPYRRRSIPDRRLHPRQWGRSMRARLGGLTVQKLYRKFGVHPTAPATAARRAKRAEQERRQSAASTSVAYTAPVVSSAVQRVPGVSYSTTGAEISVALDYSQPIGRRERLAAERNGR